MRGGVVGFEAGSLEATGMRLEATGIKLEATASAQAAATGHPAGRAAAGRAAAAGHAAAGRRSCRRRRHAATPSEDHGRGFALR